MCFRADITLKQRIVAVGLVVLTRGRRVERGEAAQGSVAVASQRACVMVC